MTQYTLTQLALLIEDAVTTALPDTLWVRAEIASLTERNGHAWFDLVEKDARGGLLAARMRANCWSSIWGMLRAFFREETGTDLQAGMQILIEAEVTHHPVYGLSLNIVGIDPKYTAGDLAQQRQHTLKKLEEEGVLELNKSLTLPRLTQRLAVISSDTAAGYEDFCHQLDESGFRFHTDLYPAVMQGENAERSIIAALSAVAQRENDYDAVIIIRGGGATTDLSCFDSYDLCNHCAQFPLPLLTGIGHTRDISVLDIVAHTALKTPTAVAAFLIDRQNTLLQQIGDLRQRLAHIAERHVMLRRHRIDLLRQRLDACSPERIYERGYSRLTANGQLVRSVSDIRSGQLLCTHLTDGVIQSTAL